MQYNIANNTKEQDTECTIMNLGDIMLQPQKGHVITFT